MTQRDLNLCQRRWLELLKDYGLVIEYHPRKANVIVDALSRKTITTLLSFRDKLTMVEDGVLLAELVVKPTHLSQILKEQLEDTLCACLKQKMMAGEIMNLSAGKDGNLRYRNRMVVPVERKLKEEIIREVHQEPFAFHSGSIKMYQDQRNLYWWPGMKREILELTCLTCQRVKAEHQVP
ncbi:integrase [Gossypium australe]|uniref:Integrase n=1 Tax=Gossypium australe TaxID=47621 RepID=A0A5B6VLU9_9ROSI|nr:integrase [Gossypium australe]